MQGAFKSCSRTCQCICNLIFALHLEGLHGEVHHRLTGLKVGLGSRAVLLSGSCQLANQLQLRLHTQANLVIYEIGTFACQYMQVLCNF